MQMRYTSIFLVSAARSEGSACWKIRAQHIPIVQFLNKNIDKRYCFQDLGTPASLAETRVATPLNRFWSYAEKKNRYFADFLSPDPTNGEISYHEDLRKFAKTGPLDVFDQAVGDVAEIDQRAPVSVAVRQPQELRRSARQAKGNGSGKRSIQRPRKRRHVHIPDLAQANNSVIHRACRAMSCTVSSGTACCARAKWLRVLCFWRNLRCHLTRNAGVRACICNGPKYSSWAV